MNIGMYIVKANGAYYGPFLKEWAESFAAKAGDRSEVLPLRSPKTARETNTSAEVKLLDDSEYRSRVDVAKAETLAIIAGATQKVFLARQAERVLMADELQSISDDLGKAHSAVESLMHYVEAVIEHPSAERIEALRKAFWRNRGSWDFDPHYSQRNWQVKGSVWKDFSELDGGVRPEAAFRHSGNAAPGGWSA